MLRVREVANKLGVHPATVYRLIEAGRLPAHRFGSGTIRPGAFRVPESAVQAFLTESAAKPV